MDVLYKPFEYKNAHKKGDEKAKQTLAEREKGDQESSQSGRGVMAKRREKNWSRYLLSKAWCSRMHAHVAVEAC